MRCLAVALLLVPFQEPDVPTTPLHSNHLVGQTSPYLLQHAHNPVDWYPWGPEALKRAKAENKPIFLSIGYSACHWCHVMERESFEDGKVAAFLNEHYVSIKVDREERPDLDDLYMSAVQAMTGGGGWPMTVFLTTDLKPFYGGTYFPPLARGDMPGFMDLLVGIDNAWKQDHARVQEVAASMGKRLAVEYPAAPESALPEAEALVAAEQRWLRAFVADFDPEWGGFGQAPKFPPSEALRWLLRSARHLPEAEAQQAREIALTTLQRMAQGGMHDQIGGGFARYSVNRTWMVPHFEKMLYDQGGLIPAYLEGWRASGDPALAAVVRSACDYLLRERRDPAGGFWSATDADSEGEEGKFFVWTPAELEEVLGAEDARLAAAFYGVSARGNFEHATSILSGYVEPLKAVADAGIEIAGANAEEREAAARQRIESIRSRLYEARTQRIPPLNDDKVLTGWNGLAIDALAQAGRMLDEARYTDAAVVAAEFLLRELRLPEVPDSEQAGRVEGVGGAAAGAQAQSRWLRAWRKGKAQHRAVLEDHAYLCRGFLSLFQSTGEERWLNHARELAEIMVHRFWDEQTGIFWDTDGHDESLLARLKSPWDGATPSANAVALETLTMLHAFTQEERWRTLFERGLAAVLPMIERGPRGFPATMLALPLAVQDPAVAVVIGNGSRDSLGGWRDALYAPGSPVDLIVFRSSAAPDSALEMYAKRDARDGQATLYLCRGNTCLLPQTEPQKLRVQ